jgi:hypothetical protein
MDGREDELPDSDLPAIFDILRRLPFSLAITG